MMKLFLKRDTSGEKAGFVILDETGFEKYIVTVKGDKTKQKIIIRTPEKKIASEILNKDLVIRYFSLKCNKRFYVLVPFVQERFAFAIYGSTYRFLGDMEQGCFSLIDVDKSPVMTQKKCWGKFGDGFEIQIFNEEQEIFSLSVAVCAAMYISGVSRAYGSLDY